MMSETSGTLPAAQQLPFDSFSLIPRVLEALGQHQSKASASAGLHVFACVSFLSLSFTLPFFLSSLLLRLPPFLAASFACPKEPANSGAHGRLAALM